MEREGKFLGGVHAWLLVRTLRGWYGIIATTEKIIGIKPFIGEVSDEELIRRSLSSRDFEISKDEINRLKLKKPGTFIGGHLKILPKSGKEIQIKFVLSGLGTRQVAMSVYQKVKDLMQAFYPEAVELED